MAVEGRYINTWIQYNRSKHIHLVLVTGPEFHIVWVSSAVMLLQLLLLRGLSLLDFCNPLTCFSVGNVVYFLELFCNTDLVSIGKCETDSKYGRSDWKRLTICRGNKQLERSSSVYNWARQTTLGRGKKFRICLHSQAECVESSSDERDGLVVHVDLRVKRKLNSHFLF